MEGSDYLKESRVLDESLSQLRTMAYKFFELTLTADSFRSTRTRRSIDVLPKKKHTIRRAVSLADLVESMRQFCPGYTASSTKHAGARITTDSDSKAENGETNMNSNHAASPADPFGQKATMSPKHPASPADPFGQKATMSPKQPASPEDTLGQKATMSPKHPALSAVLLLFFGLLTIGYAMGGFFVRKPPAIFFNRDFRAYFMCLPVFIVAGLLEVVAGVWACRDPVGRKSVAGAALAVSVPVLLFTGYITADW